MATGDLTNVGWAAAWGSAFGAVGVIGAQWLRSRMELTRGSIGVQAERERAVIDGYNRLVDQLQERVDELEKDGVQSRKDFREMQVALYACEQAHREDTVKIAALQRTNEEQEVKIKALETKVRGILGYSP